MQFSFDYQPSDSPLVEAVWRTRSNGGGYFDSLAESHWGLIITKQNGGASVTLLGPQTQAKSAPVPEDAEMMGVVFKLGTIMPQLAVADIVDKGITMPAAAKNRFWLYGSSWQIPDFENIDTFIAKLTRQGGLAHEPVVAKALAQDSPKGLSTRSMQRQFLRTTGMTRNTVRQIERARSALLLMQQGIATTEVIGQTGYYDQPHLIRSFAHYLGHRPTQINNLSDWRRLLNSTF